MSYVCDNFIATTSNILQLGEIHPFISSTILNILGAWMPMNPAASQQAGCRNAELPFYKPLFQPYRMEVLIMEQY